MLTRPPESLPVADQQIDLSWFVLGAVDAVESFRFTQSRLPSREDLVGILDDEVTYTVVGEGYVVVAETNGVQVEYRSGVTLERWISLQGLDSEGSSP